MIKKKVVNEIRQIVHSLYESKEITKKVYNNIIINTVKLHSVIKMDTIFMNSENSETSEARILILSITDKLDLRRGGKIIASSNLSIYYA